MNIQSDKAPDGYPERLEHAKHRFHLRERFLHHDEALLEIVKTAVLKFIRLNPSLPVSGKIISGFSHHDSPSHRLPGLNPHPKQSQK